MGDTPPKKRTLAEIEQDLHDAVEKTPTTVLKAFFPDGITAAGRELVEITSETWKNASYTDRDI